MILFPIVILLEAKKYQNLQKNGILKLLLLVLITQKSHGLAEKAVQIAKSMLIKAFHTQTDIKLFLLNYRNTPVANLNYSPADVNE